ncbi:MAG: quinone-dependent dihydroorotate dehydrogenase [Steroidobacter sp.]
MLYRAIKPLLLSLEPERAHAVTFSLLRAAHRTGFLSLIRASQTDDPVTLMGLSFRNRLGIAAGLDKNATCIDALGALGAGFVEVGTVTPRAQPGNPKPRVFRIPQALALINRMGFPNDGVDAMCARLQARRYRGVCGVNIGKNASTPLENAVDDYVTCLRAVAPYADYVTVNVSSPNTAGLRSLQAVDHLKPILSQLLEVREQLRASIGRHLPLLVKIAPDLHSEELQQIAALLRELKIDGVIATNTTLQRPEQWSLGIAAQERGGLSGAPVHALSLSTVRQLRDALGDAFPIIGVGGITAAAQAQAMRDAGADLIQIYTGLIYRGPALIRDALHALAEH